MRWLIAVVFLFVLFVSPAYANDYTGKIVPVLFVPKDRQVENLDRVKEEIQAKIQGALNFYARERQIHGFGDKDLESVPAEVVVGTYNHDYYEKESPNGWFVSREIAEKFYGNPYADLISIFAIFLYKDPGDKKAQASGSSDEQGGRALFPVHLYWPEWPTWQTVAHEVGHTLGLEHDFSSDRYIMAYGKNRDQLGPQSIAVLRSSPYFNSPEEPAPEPEPVNEVPVPAAITSFTMAIHGGLSFIHVPVDDPGVNTVSDVFQMLGKRTFMVVYLDQEGIPRGYSEPFNKPSDPVNIALQPHTGLIAAMGLGVSLEITFEGPPYQSTTVPLKKGKEGLNLVGLPTNDARIRKFSDLAGLSPNILGITGQNQAGGLKGYPGVDLPIRGGQSFIVIVSDDTVLELSGQAWEQEPQMAAPALTKAPSPAEQLEQLQAMGITLPELPVLKSPVSLSTTWAEIKKK